MLGGSITDVSSSFAFFFFRVEDRYWTLHREQAKEKGAFKQSLRSSIWRTLRYHAGTVAFGALVIAVVQFLRACLAYLDKQTKNLQKKNALIRIMFKVVACCLPVMILQQRTFLD